MTTDERLELADLAEKAGYTVIFNAIAAAVNTPYEGAVGISVAKFIAALRARTASSREA